MPGVGEARYGVRACARLALATVAVVLLLGAAARPAPAAASPQGPVASIARVEHTIVRCTNRERVARGLPALRRNSMLRHAARYHARNMLRYHFFAHRDPFGQSPVQRVARFGGRNRFHWIGENIAVGSWSASQVCQAWMGSPEHRSNILSRHFTLIGVGFARAGGRTYYVQDFGSR